MTDLAVPPPKIDIFRALERLRTRAGRKGNLWLSQSLLAIYGRHKTRHFPRLLLSPSGCPRVCVATIGMDEVVGQQFDDLAAVYQSDARKQIPDAAWYVTATPRKTASKGIFLGAGRGENSALIRLGNISGIRSTSSALQVNAAGWWGHGVYTRVDVAAVLTPENSLTLKSGIEYQYVEGHVWKMPACKKVCLKNS